MASRYKKADTPEEHSLPFYTGRSRIIIRRVKTGRGSVSGGVSVALAVAMLKSPVREHFHLTSYPVLPSKYADIIKASL